MAKKPKLNPKQKKFCKLYATTEDFFGNGTEAYIEAYKPEKVGNWYASARTGAWRLLTNIDILEEIDRLLEIGGLNDGYVDKQLHFLIQQRADLRTKLGAISEYNKLKARITNKIDHTTKGSKLTMKVVNYLDPKKEEVEKDG